MVQCERLVLRNIDQKIVRHFIGYFYERDQEAIQKMMANSFPLLQPRKQA